MVYQNMKKNSVLFLIIIKQYHIFSTGYLSNFFILMINLFDKLSEKN